MMKLKLKLLLLLSPAWTAVGEIRREDEAAVLHVADALCGFSARAEATRDGPSRLLLDRLSIT